MAELFAFGNESFGFSKMLGIYIFDIFVNCNWVVIQWQ